MMNFGASATFTAASVRCVNEHRRLHPNAPTPRTCPTCKLGPCAMNVAPSNPPAEPFDTRAEVPDRADDLQVSAFAVPKVIYLLVNPQDAERAREWATRRTGSTYTYAVVAHPFVMPGKAIKITQD